MRIFGIEITTSAAIEEQVKSRAEVIASGKASDIIRRYAGNETCLRAAVAARMRTKEDNLFVPSGLLENESRMITAFADRLAEVRTGARP